MQQRADFFSNTHIYLFKCYWWIYHCWGIGIYVLNLQVLKGSYFPFKFSSCSPFLALLSSFHHTCTHIRTLGTLNHRPFYFLTDFHRFFKGETMTTLYYLEVDKRFLFELMELNQNRLAECFNPELPDFSRIIQALNLYILCEAIAHKPCWNRQEWVQGRI